MYKLFCSTSKMKIMKSLIYFLGVVFLTTSCKSVDKMVEKGEYNRAFQYAIHKLSGQKNKKTKHIQGLEKAYEKMNALTLREIERMDAQNYPAFWSQVALKYSEIIDRQDRLEALLPLTSVDGYEGRFELKNYHAVLLEAEENACEYHLENGKNLLDRAEKSEDKALGRKAFDEFAIVSRIRPHYKDVDIWLERARKSGMIQVSMRVNNQLVDFHSFDIERRILDLPLAGFNKNWVEFGVESENFKFADYLIFVDLEHIFFSPEREVIEKSVENKDILIRTDKSKVQKDSAEVWVEKEIYQAVSATVINVNREKFSELNGQIRIVDTKSQQNIDLIPVRITHTFSSSGCFYEGDARALSDESKEKIKRAPEPFPSDFFLATQMSDNLSEMILSQLRSFKP